MKGQHEGTPKRHQTRFEEQLPTSGCSCLMSKLVGDLRMDSEDKGSSLQVSPRPKLRSCSMKKPRRPMIEDLDEMRPRTSSLPTRNSYKRRQYLSPTVSTEGELYRVRSFETTSKGIINRGDSFKSKSSNSIVSSGSSTTDHGRLSRSPSVNSQGSTEASLDSAGCQLFRVCVLGSPGVGKTALMQQFMTSEYIGGFDTSLGKYDSLIIHLAHWHDTEMYLRHFMCKIYPFNTCISGFQQQNLS